MSAALTAGGILACSRVVGGTGEGPAVREFKKFLSTPPIVQRVIFSERQPPDPQHPSRLDLPLAASHVFRYYEGSLQGDAFLLREIANADSFSDLKVRGLLAASDGVASWFHFGSDRRDNIVEFGLGDTNEARRAAYLSSYNLRQVLMLGIMRSTPGSVEWQGNRFRVTSCEKALSAWGDLELTESGSIAWLNVTYRLDSGDVHWRIRYRFGDGDLTGLPYEIRCFLLHDGAETEIAEFRVHQLRLGSRPLSRDDFRPERIVAENRWKTVAHTNNDFYLLATDGTSRKLNISSRPPSPGNNSGHLAVVPAKVYAIWGGANASILILAWRVKAKTQKPKKAKENR